MVEFHPSRFSPDAAITMLRSWHSWHLRDTTSRFGPSGKSRCCATAVPNVATVSARVPYNRIDLLIQLSPFFWIDLLARYLARGIKARIFDLLARRISLRAESLHHTRRNTLRLP